MSSRFATAVQHAIELYLPALGHGRRVRELEAQVAARDRDIAAVRQAHIEQAAQFEAQIASYQTAYEEDIAARDRDMAGVRQAHIEQVAQFEAQIASYQAAYAERVGALETHVELLTKAAVDRERDAQRQRDDNYQLLMAHQQRLAAFKDLDPEFFELYERCKQYTMTSLERLYSLYKSVEYIAKARIPGDLVECGVWRGGSCMLMASHLLELGESDRRIAMYDTFEGHPAPDPHRDVDLWGNNAHAEWQQRTNNGEQAGWGLASLEEVRRNLEATGYPPAHLAYIKGMVEQTASVDIPERLSLLRLDTDWYQSTLAALRNLYPRLAPGGVLIIDDFGHYEGQRQAVTEYFTATGEQLLFHRIDYSCRIATKL